MHVITRKRLYATAAIIGAVVWLCCGTVTGMASFEYHGPMHENLQGEDRDNAAAFSILPFKVGGVWALCGALVGVIVMARFIAQPTWAHMTLVPVPFFGRPGPKSEAELRTIPVAIALGFVSSILLYYFFIRVMNLPPTTTLTGISPIVAVASTTVLSVNILPLALKWAKGGR